MNTVKELSKHAFFDHACEQTLFVRAFNFVCCRYTPSKELKELASEAGLFAHELWSMQNDEEVLHAIKAKEKITMADAKRKYAEKEAKEFATRELRKVEEDNSEDDSSEDEDDDNSEDEDDSDDEDEDDGDDEDDNNVEDDDGEEDHDKRRKRLERKREGHWLGERR